MATIKKIVISDQVFAQEVDGESVLLDMESENYFGLDGVGTSIWHAIEKYEGDFDKIFEALKQEYDVDETTLLRDLENFLNNLQENGLIRFETK